MSSEEELDRLVYDQVIDIDTHTYTYMDQVIQVTCMYAVFKLAT